MLWFKEIQPMRAHTGNQVLLHCRPVADVGLIAD